MGNVGVGTSSPSRAFVLSGTDPFLRVNNDSTGNSALEFSTLGVAKGFVGTAGSANGLVAGSVAGDTIIRTQGQKLLFTVDSGTSVSAAIDTSGNFLIGTTTANTGKLVVNGSIEAYSPTPATGANIYLTSNGSATNRLRYQQPGSTGSSFAIRDETAGVDRLTINSTGQVTIPYASTTALTVSGDGKSLDVGSGANSLVYTNFAGGRAFVGYDGNNAFIQGGNTKGLIFNVNNATVGSGEVARFTSEGFLGIGTTSPVSTLSVQTTGTTDAVTINSNSGNNTTPLKVYAANSTNEGLPTVIGTEVAIFQRNRSSSYGAAIALVGGTGTGGGAIYFGDKDDIDIGRINYTNSTDAFGFFTNNSEKLSITSNGEVGIGTTSPRSILATYKSQSGLTTIGNARVLSLQNSSGAINELQEIGFGYQATSGNYSQPVVIGHRVTSGTSNSMGDFYVATRAVTTDTYPTERLTVTAAGNVGIGTTSPRAKLEIMGTGSVTETNFTQTTANNAIVISNTNVNSYAPGVVWALSDGNITKPYAGMWASRGANGASLFLGTAASYSTGITGSGNGLTIDPSGDIGISSSTPTYLLSLGTGSTAFSVSSTGVATSSVFNAVSTTVPNILPVASTTALTVSTNAYFPGTGVWNSSGNVGINTAVPTAMLHLTSTNGAANTAKILIQEGRGAGNDASLQLSTTNNSNDAYVQFTRSGIGSWVMGSDGSDSNTFKIDRATSLTTSAAFNILTGGNVGLGTSTPGTLLSLGNTGNSTINLSTSATSTFGTGINIRGGCYAVNGTCISGGSGSGTVNSSSDLWLPYYTGAGTTLSGTSSIRLSNFRGHPSVILGDESASVSALGRFQVNGNFSESAARTYTNSTGQEGLVINPYYVGSYGYSDFVAQRFSTTGIGGGSSFRFFTQPISSSAPNLAFAVDDQMRAAIYGGNLNGGALNTSSVGNGMDLAISGGSTASSSSGTVKIAVGYLFQGSGTEVEGGHGGNVYIAGGGNSDNTASAGFPAAGNAGNVYLAMGGDGTNGSADGNDGTVQIGGSFKNNAILNVYGDVKVRLSPTGGAVSTFGVCHDGTDINATGNTTLRKLVACSAAPSDVAEMYPTKSEVEPGDIVAASSDELEYMAEGGDPYNGTVTDLGTTTISILKRATKGESGVLGVISTGPFQTFGRDIQKVEGANAKPLALVGRVPVKVTLEGGDIKPGDRITLSSTPGVGMKASTSGMSIGVAISSFNTSSPRDSNGIGMVNVFVNLSYAKLDGAVTNGSLADGLWSLDESTGRIKAFSSLDLNNMDINNVRSIQSGSGDWSISADGILVVKEVRTQKLCLGQICITETDLKSLLDHAGLGAVITAPSGDTGSTTASSTPPSGGNGGDTPPPTETPPTDPAPTDPTPTEPPPSDTPPATGGDTPAPASDPAPSPTPDPAPAPAPDPAPAPAVDPPPSTP
jgi:hypothetical protein